MSDSRKTKAQLIEEVQTLRARIKKLEKQTPPSGFKLGKPQVIPDEILDKIDINAPDKIAEQITEALFVIDTDFIIRSANKAALELFGYSMEELRGKSAIILANRPQLSERIKHIKDLLLAGNTYIENDIHHKKNGQSFVAEIMISPISGKDGKINGFILVERDVSERHRLVKQLQQDEQRQRLIIQNAPVLIDTIDLNGLILSWNRECERVTGYTADEIVGNPKAFEMLYPDNVYRERMLKELQQFKKSFRDWEWTLTCKDGGQRIISWSVVSADLYDSEKVHLNVGIDITERRRAEKRLRMLQAVVDRAADGIICHTPDGRIFYANDAATRILGYSHEKLLTLTAFDIGAAANRESIPDVLEQARVNTSCTLTPVVKGYADKAIPIELTVNYVDHYGEHIYFLFFRDITRRTRTQQALRESEARFRNTFEQAAVGIAHISLDGYFIRINSRFCTIMGYTRDELLDMTVEDITHSDSRDEDMQNVHKLLKNVIPHYSMEMKYVRRDNTPGWVNLTVSLVRNDDGEPLYFISVIEDIARRKEVETALREERDFVAQLMQTSPVGIATVDREGIITYTNRRASEILNLDFGNDKQRLYNDIEWQIMDFDGNPFPIKKLPFNVVRHTGQAVNDVQHAIQWPDGHKVLLSISAAPLFDAADEFNGMIAVIEDITRRKQIDLQLQASLQEKEILLQEIHHRVKNNLQLVSSLLSLQTESVADENILQALRDSQTRIRTMALIHEALYNADDLSSINAHSYFRDLANYVTRTYRDRVQHVKLVADIDPVTLTIQTAIPCGLIINELLSNALKHAFPKGDTGEIHVSFHREGDGQVRLTVRDNGIGLSPDVNPDQPVSLGLQLIKTLAGQINAAVDIHRENGTAFVLSFVADSTRKE